MTDAHSRIKDDQSEVRRGCLVVFTTWRHRGRSLLSLDCFLFIQRVMFG